MHSWAVFLKGWQSSEPGREAMLILHHPYAVNHLAVLQHTDKHLSFSNTLSVKCVLSPLPCLCMFFHESSPGHQTPAPSKDGWRWPLACGCSRSLCCGRRSSLWGLDWTCQSSLCSPAEDSTAFLTKPVSDEPHAFLQLRPQSPVWHLQLWLSLGVSLAAFWYASD